MNRIAVLLTSYNRKTITLQCLYRLFSLKSDVDVFLVDDASEDGTSDAVQKCFPQVHVIKGTGNLYWCRGMNLAWKSAKNYHEYDYYVWLNDDLMLYDNAFEEILECSKLNCDKAIISGIVQGKYSKEAVYGGYDYQHKIISPSGVMKPIRNLNGNFVLVPKYVFNTVGIFDEVYHHDVGDVDYGLTAIKQGISVLTTRCFIGSTDESFKMKGLRIRKNGTNIIGRFKKLYSPLGSNPFTAFHFINKHYGAIKAIIYFIYLHVINIVPDPVFNILPRYKQ